MNTYCWGSMLLQKIRNTSSYILSTYKQNVMEEFIQLSFSTHKTKIQVKSFKLPRYLIQV